MVNIHTSCNSFTGKLKQAITFSDIPITGKHTPQKDTWLISSHTTAADGQVATAALGATDVACFWNPSQVNHVYVNTSSKLLHFPRTAPPPHAKAQSLRCADTGSGSDFSRGRAQELLQVLSFCWNLHCQKGLEPPMFIATFASSLIFTTIFIALAIAVDATVVFLVYQDHSLHWVNLPPWRKFPLKKPQKSLLSKPLCHIKNTPL